MLARMAEEAGKQRRLICRKSSVPLSNAGSTTTRTNAKTVLLGAGNILTVWEGRKDVWNCQQFELSEESKRLLESFEALNRNRREEK
jgi:hypothetical protein